MIKYPLRTVLIGFFVVQVAVMTTAVSYLAFQRGQEAVYTVADTLLSEIVHRVEERLQTFVLDAPRVNALNRAAIENGVLSLDQDEGWFEQFWGLKDQFPKISYFTVADQRGEWMGLQTHGRLLWHATEKSKGMNTYAISQSGRREDQIHHVDIYDTLSWDWFRLPFEHRRAIWSPIYAWANPRVLSITLSEPIAGPHDDLIGVVAVDLTLGEIQDYLRTLDIGKTGHAFLLERDGRLIAASGQAAPFIESADGPQRLRATAYPNPTIARVSANLEQQYETLGQIHQLQKLKFGQGRDIEHVRVAPFNDAFGLDWLLVVVVPEADFMGSIYEGIYQTIWICLAVLCLTIGFGVIYSGHISKPLKRLSKLVQNVRRHELDNNFDVDSRVVEVQALARALSCMQAGLLSFQRFAPAHVVHQVLADGEEMQLGGEMRDVTIMFSDLARYSTLIENLSPERVIAFMNIYFGEMETIISDHKGVLLEVQGDAMLAVFGAPEVLADHRVAATHCALAMQARLEVINHRWRRTDYAEIGGFDGVLELRHRTGIHSGEVLAGNIGGQQYMKYGVIGDVVNVAARLEELNKDYGTDMLISSEVYAALPDKLRSKAKNQGEIQLRGREQSQCVYSFSSRTRAEGPVVSLSA